MPIDAYIAAVQAEAARGNATEHTFRPALKALLESLDTGIAATNEPRRIACGAPDYQVARGNLPVGHVEAKDLHVDLDKEARSGQMARYLKALPNLILTNYLDFRWFVNGELREEARIGRYTPLSSPRQRGESGGYKIVREPQGEMDLNRLLQGFLSQQPPVVGTPRDLALRLAEMARLTRTLIAETFKREDQRGELHEQYDAFRKALIPGLDADEFADMYAQTLAYGLFAARVNTPLPPAPSPQAERGSRGGGGGEVSFTRYSAAQLLPKTNPFLSKLFYEIAGPDLDDRIAWAVDDIAALLARADMSEILRNFGKRTRQEDPVVHFYETFLAAYDPKMRESRGVYYTPEPVVSFIVRSVDHLLRTRFGKALGLADQDTLILDPATGTATFLYFVVEQIYETLRQNGLESGWNSYVGDGPRSLLRRLFGFELLMAPYAVAHLKLGLQLQEKGYDFGRNERLGVYLTNALDEGVPAQTTMPFARYIADESAAAAEVKSSKPIMVVLGNPPYSGHSENNSPFIRGLIDDYMRVDGAPLGERNPKWLQDDYVKFIRFGQWRIGKTGEGVLAYISNNGYLDNPTFRGMRQSLMRSFDDIYILNLHGNANKKERAPNGGPDENVFDIRQGVAIALFVKRTSPPNPLSARGEGEARSAGGEVATIHYADLWGVRESKYAELTEHDIDSIKWDTLAPSKPFYLFVPQNVDLRGEYEGGWTIKSMFPAYSSGIITARDHFSVSFDKDTLLHRVSQVQSETNIIDVENKYEIHGTREISLQETLNMLRSIKDLKLYVKTLLYRPFDKRQIFYHKSLVRWPVEEIMNHFLDQNNIGVMTTRSIEIGSGFEHVLATDTIMTLHTVSMKEINYLFPLYLYPSTEKKQSQASLFDDAGDEGAGPGGRRANLSAEFIADLTGKLGAAWVPDGRGSVGKPHPPTPSPLAERGSRGSGGGEVSGSRGSGGGEVSGSRGGGDGDGGDVKPEHSWQTSPELWAKLKPVARQMRHEPTPAENALWQALRNNQLNGLKFRRQHSIDRFVVDFYCPEARLIVEVDGPIHDYTPEEDAVRQAFLESAGYRVVRFSNDTVLHNLPGVLEIIQASLATSPSPNSDRGSSFATSPSPNSDRGSSFATSPSPNSERGLGGEVLTVGPEDVFHYAYAVFHSPTYRSRYAELLKIDFPRLPLTGDRALFADLAALGAELVDLHLLRLPGAVQPDAVGGNGGHPALANLRTRFQGGGANIVEKISYDAADERVYISKTHYFEGVDKATWEFRVGGYQVLDKWLKDRKGRPLSFDDLLHYQRVYIALAETRRIMAAIDARIGAWPIG